MTTAEPAFERSLLLSDDTDVTSLHQAAAGNDWPIAYTNHCAHGEYEQTLWTTKSTETRVRYLEHHTTGTRFVSVYGDSESDFSAAIDIVDAAVNVVSVEQVVNDLLAENAEDPVEIVRGFRRLSTAHYVARIHAHTPGPLDPRYVTAVERHVAHPHRQVRLSVMLVADELSTLWPELTAPIVARHGVEEELADLVEAFVEVAESRA